MQKWGCSEVAGCLETAFILIGCDSRASQVAPVVKNPLANAGDVREVG